MIQYLEDIFVIVCLITDSQKDDFFYSKSCNMIVNCWNVDDVSCRVQLHESWHI
jgi:hypothetical protein